ncbi:MAG: AAA domain-containing protein [bacterium]|nr:AAA domain-containing protein [bacterium]
METSTLLIFVGLAFALGLWIGKRLRAVPAPAANGPAASATGREDKSAELYEIARELDGVVDSVAKPADLLAHPTFECGVCVFVRPEWSVDELLEYYRGDSIVFAALALESLSRRSDDGRDVRDPVLETINHFAPLTRFFALRLLDAKTPAGEPLSGKLLCRLDDSWEWPVNARVLGEFLRRRVQGGEKLALGGALESVKDASGLKDLLELMPADVQKPLLDELAAWSGRRVDVDLLNSIGRVWMADADRAGEPVIEHDAILEDLATVEATLFEPPLRSAVLVGEHGVGKTALARLAARRFAARGGVVFEAGFSELIAGMVYIGQLEERMRELLEALVGRKIVWFVPDFHALAMAGRHKYSSTSVLDVMLPEVEAGRIVVIGETTPGAYERLVQSKPRVKTALETLRIHPLPESGTRALVDSWADAHAGGEAGLGHGARDEALLLAQQFLGDRAAPGNVLKLLQLTRTRLETERSGETLRIGSEDLIATLAHQTGLPGAVLDERQGLELEALHAFFVERVKGQPEAVDCLVERVAMIKAGLTDPKRPLGVFLFAGPTGTGKTEIAKTLAAFLFGSEDRMLRLDMSELQTPESLDRIIGGSDSDERGGALVDRIRKQPFAVVLLDEFEKAHPNVWDLFLQLFDDGRLTDRSGSTADFRNAIVVLTSNLGSKIESGAGLGFQDERGRFSEARVMRVVESAFRKEFLNRLDRVVVFRPLGRDTMRRILHKELAAAFRRRGLRNRAWAVEWDASAVELLLRAGFTVDLGARPLRRAIEQRLLAPLSKTIVNHQYPAGDQFLFVRAEGDELVVDFVDPDGADAHDERPPPVADAGILLEQIALEPRGSAAEVAVLRAAHGELRGLVDDEPWQARKRDGLTRMQQPGFWDSSDRFDTLGDVEYFDRIEAGVASAGSLMDRLAPPTGAAPARARYPRKIFGRLAGQLFVLRAACREPTSDRPRDAFVQVEAWSDGGRPSRHADEFARRVGGMYRKWAGKRRMQVETLREWGGDDREAFGMLLSVSGYAAFALLSAEHGLHVMELPDEHGHNARRAAVRVRVAGQPAAPPRQGGGGLARQAQETIGAQEGNVSVVRRYRERPSPLVRDTARGWRSGHFERVLDGDFDLIANIRGGDDP